MVVGLIWCTVLGGLEVAIEGHGASLLLAKREAVDAVAKVDGYPPKSQRVRACEVQRVRQHAGPGVCAGHFRCTVARYVDGHVGMPLVVVHRFASGEVKIGGHPRHRHGAVDAARVRRRADLWRTARPRERLSTRRYRARAKSAKCQAPRTRSAWTRAWSHGGTGSASRGRGCLLLASPWPSC